MVPHTVKRVALVVTEDVSGVGYTLVTHVTTDASEQAETTKFRRLSFTELVDVMLSVADDQRPGTFTGPGWSQPPLPLDG